MWDNDRINQRKAAMVILYATVHQRSRQGEKAKHDPSTFISKSVAGLIRQIKQHMADDHDLQSFGDGAIDALNNATDLQAMSAWFDNHYAYFDMTTGSMAIAD